MPIAQLSLEILSFGFSLWLGLYLINRNLTDARLRFAGLGLISYAIGLSLDILATNAADRDLVRTLAAWARPFYFLPALFWLALLLRLVPSDTTLRQRLQRHPRPVGVIVAASLFFALGLGFILFPLKWLPRFWLVLGIGFDLALLGLAVAVLDAFDEGESLRPHFWRALDYAFLTALLFGGQVVLAMVLSEGVTLPMLILLLTTITAAIVVQTFSETLQKLLDQVAFVGSPAVRLSRQELHAAASAATRLNRTLDVDALDPAEFTRLTRRALGHMGNLPRLAASPLTQMRLVRQRLDPDVRVGTLERANALKALLTESICRLKPPGRGEFGTADEWRHYNALYYPYVLGLKPYSRRLRRDDLTEDAHRALEWFRADVPQRTLYNWQNAAAALVAQDLLERSRTQQARS